MAYRPQDLDDLERALLGVLCVGLPPPRAAGDDSFRVDHVTAVIAGLLEGERHRHLGSDALRVTPAFRESLRATIEALAEKGLVVADQPADMPAPPGSFEPGVAIDVVDPDAHPVVLDRHLAQECMEALFNIPAVYPFLMERYSASGAVWRRLREGGYGE